LRRLLVDLSKLDQFEDFDAALASLAFGEERVRPAHARGNFALRQARSLAGRDQLFKELVVESLMGSISPLARYTGLRLTLFPHLSSVVNA